MPNFWTFCFLICSHGFNLNFLSWLTNWCIFFECIFFYLSFIVVWFLWHLWGDSIYRQCDQDKDQIPCLSPETSSLLLLSNLDFIFDTDFLLASLIYSLCTNLATISFIMPLLGLLDLLRPLSFHVWTIAVFPIPVVFNLFRPEEPLIGLNSSLDSSYPAITCVNWLSPQN